MGKLINTYNRLGPELFWKKLIGCEAVFTCAIRNKQDLNLFDAPCNSSFTLIPESKEFWFADPLFFVHKNRTFLFMEAFSYSKQKGEIAFSEIVEGKCSKSVSVIEESFHLSFPNVFTVNNEIFMIPEATASGGIIIYRCLDFPNKWERFLFLKTDIPIVDSIIDHISHHVCYFSASTYSNKDPKQTKFVRFSIDLSLESTQNIQIKYIDNSSFSYEKRNAGRYIRLNDNSFIHSIQTSTPAVYGYSLKFVRSVITKDQWKKDKVETKEILPGDINLIGWKKKLKLIGVHTYDASDRYEVIDVQYLRWNPLKWIRRATRK